MLFNCVMLKHSPPASFTASFGRSSPGEVINSIDKLPFENKYFDFVNCAGVLHHVIWQFANKIVFGRPGKTLRNFS